MSKYRMRVFSTNRNYVLTASSADEMEAWITALQGSLAEHYTHHEMVEKAEAAEVGNLLNPGADTSHRGGV